MESDNEFGKFIYCLINLFFVLLSVIIQRRVFIVFGVIGINIYLGHLAFQLFKDSMLFPVVLSLLGLMIIYIGIVYRRHKIKIEETILKFVPDFIRNLNPVLKRLED